jgi:hypothetical protein
MKPIIVVPPDAITPEDLQALRDNGLCVVTAKDPASIKFLDPIIPATTSRTEIERAAIELSRRLLTDNQAFVYNKGDVTKLFAQILLRGSPLDSRYEEWKAQELILLAKADAKAERAEAKGKAHAGQKISVNSVLSVVNTDR